MTELVSKDAFESLPERYRQRAREIARRVREIDAIIVPGSASDIRDAVVRLRGQLRPQPDIEVPDLASEFKAACRDLPAWAISEAANDFLAGRVENHSGQFMPTCAEFAKRARTVMVPFLAERASLRVEASKLVERAEDDRRRHLIAMEREDPAVRKRVAALTDAVMAGHPKGKVALTHSWLSDEKQKRLDALKKPREFESRITQTRLGKRAGNESR